jgi:hypothetical protein
MKFPVGRCLPVENSSPVFLGALSLKLTMKNGMVYLEVIVKSTVLFLASATFGCVASSMCPFFLFQFLIVCLSIIITWITAVGTGNNKLRVSHNDTHFSCCVSGIKKACKTKFNFSLIFVYHY